MKLHQGQVYGDLDPLAIVCTGNGISLTVDFPEPVLRNLVLQKAPNLVSEHVFSWGRIS